MITLKDNGAAYIGSINGIRIRVLPENLFRFLVWVHQSNLKLEFIK